MRHPRPVAVEQLLARAAEDPGFATELVRDRRSALERSGLELTEVDERVLASVSDERLRQMLTELRSSCASGERRAVLQAIGAGVLGVVVGGAGCDCDSRGRQYISFGVRPEEPPPSWQISAEELVVKGAIDPEVVRQVLLRQIGQTWPTGSLEVCFAKAKQKVASPLRAKLVLEIDSDGAVRSAQSSILRPEGGPLASCLRDAPQRWRFPRTTDGRPATISVVVAMRPPRDDRR